MNRIYIFTLIFLFAAGNVYSLALEPEASDYNGEELNLNISSSSRCTFGDFDSIAYEMVHSKNPKLILSISSVEDGQEVATEILSEFSDSDQAAEQLRDVIKNYKSKGSDTKINIADLKKPGMYWVKICSDQQGLNSCQGKPVKSFEEITKKFENVKTDLEIKDKVYFVNLLHLKPAELETPVRKLISLKQEDLKDYLDYAGVKLSKSKIKSLQHDLDLTDSHPLKLSTNKIAIDLPFYDRRRCS